MSLDVAAVVAALGIEGKVRARRFWALCPYHEDHDPSWMVRTAGPRAGQHHCYVCKEGGTLVDLVQHVRGYVTREMALEWLETASVEAPPEPLPSEVRMVVPALRRRAFRVPAEVIFRPLAEWVTPPRQYLERRGVPAGQVARWGIGYAVDGRLGGRVVLVVRDTHGRPANYMGRAFGDQDRRYLYPHSKEEPRLDAMFGEEHWGEASTEVVVVEGGFNGLAVERAVPDLPIAALGGSDVRMGHLTRLARFERVVVATDADAAGDAAAEALYAGLARRCDVVRARPVFDGGVDLDEACPRRVAELIVGALSG